MVNYTVLDSVYEMMFMVFVQEQQMLEERCDHCAHSLCPALKTDHIE